ncbi:hypothetical protein P7K49_012953 [Saguinus oedipus]|uniref:Uncharacterized protein n=1 Tax=Saguinus oedipus TaxID=9490 RepID=A0ABQ9VEM9_SAGOE|nr:hypothetical protein P7K49_012953 [Saguinus oedipus]
MGRAAAGGAHLRRAAEEGPEGRLEDCLKGREGSSGRNRGAYSSFTAEGKASERSLAAPLAMPKPPRRHRGHGGRTQPSARRPSLGPSLGLLLLFLGLLTPEAPPSGETPRGRGRHRGSPEARTGRDYCPGWGGRKSGRLGSGADTAAPGRVVGAAVGNGARVAPRDCRRDEAAVTPRPGCGLGAQLQRRAGLAEMRCGEGPWRGQAGSGPGSTRCALHIPQWGTAITREAHRALRGCRARCGGTEVSALGRAPQRDPAFLGELC